MTIPLPQSTDDQLVALWHQIVRSVSTTEEDDLLVTRTAQRPIVACHGLPTPAEYSEVEELLDCFKQLAITVDPGMFVGCLPVSSFTNDFFQRVALKTPMEKSGRLNLMYSQR